MAINPKSIQTFVSASKADPKVVATKKAAAERAAKASANSAQIKQHHGK